MRCIVYQRKSLSWIHIIGISTYGYGTGLRWHSCTESRRKTCLYVVVPSFLPSNESYSNDVRVQFWKCIANITNGNDNDYSLILFCVCMCCMTPIKAKNSLHVRKCINWLTHRNKIRVILNLIKIYMQLKHEKKSVRFFFHPMRIPMNPYRLNTASDLFTHCILHHIKNKKGKKRWENLSNMIQVRLNEVWGNDESFSNDHHAAVILLYIVTKKVSSSLECSIKSAKWMDYDIYQMDRWDEIQL